MSWKTPEIEALLACGKSPEQMTVEQLLVAAAPIANGVAGLGFTVEYGSAIARQFIRHHAALRDMEDDAQKQINLKSERDEAVAELAELRKDRDADQRALNLIQRICGDDFCGDLDMQDMNEPLTGSIKTAHQKLSAVYRAAHSMVRANICHSVHDDWRKEVVEADDKLRADATELSAV